MVQNCLWQPTPLAQAWLNDMFLPPDDFDSPLNAVVVRSGDQTILIDAGHGFDPDVQLPQ